MVLKRPCANAKGEEGRERDVISSIIRIHGGRANWRKKPDTDRPTDSSVTYLFPEKGEKERFLSGHRENWSPLSIVPGKFETAAAHFFFISGGIVPRKGEKRGGRRFPARWARWDRRTRTASMVCLISEGGKGKDQKKGRFFMERQKRYTLRGLS